MAQAALTVVLSRCDRIGDLVLSLPALGLLRDAGVGRRVLHCAPYCRDIAFWAQHNELCTDVWIAGDAPPTLSGRKVGVALFHSAISAAAFRQAGLDRSWGPRSKISALWSYDKTISQKRSRVEKSEMEYNLDLVREVLRAEGRKVPDFQGLPALKVPPHWRAPFAAAPTVLVLSNRGSASNWPVEKYLDLAHAELKNGRAVDLLISGVDAESRRREVEGSGMVAKGARVVGDLASLSELIAYLASAKDVVSSSTGPLHLAHALGVNVFGVYPRIRVQSFDRWRPHGYWHTGALRYTEI